MRVGRRRFLAISAAALCSPRAAMATTWSGYGFGADISITLRGPSEITRPALIEARKTLEHIEKLFSLYDAASTLSELNASGRLTSPAPDFLHLMHASQAAYATTEGLFDPTVQTLWQARAEGKIHPTQHDWREVRFSPDAIKLSDGQTLTFNGIAQGYATDRVAAVLAAHGLTEALANIGEFKALGGPWRLGVCDPDFGLLATRTLTGTAIATSSPPALRIAGESHIMHRTQRPKWSTVSVEAATASVKHVLIGRACGQGKHRARRFLTFVLGQTVEQARFNHHLAAFRVMAESFCRHRITLPDGRMFAQNSTRGSNPR